MSDTLRVGEQLGAGDRLENGNSRLTLQGDGNLVLEQDGRPLWASGTSGRGADRAVLQPDGNFVLYAGGDAVWASETNGADADRLTLQPDRNVVLYGAGGNALWSTGTEAAEAKAESRSYTVQAGDTLSDIAGRLLGDPNRYPEIAAANGLADPDHLDIGQTLTIP
ncbi:MAG: LysM peptidoglycan-binding domain-containing protein [Mycobacteriaceae bacterium]|nr:LysM peptidoglycan-binding domain-containing protein [Mycobacteriaceae bacterium]